MAHSDDNGLPAHTWRVLGVAAVGLLLSATIAIGMISSGIFDPKPVGSLQVQAEPGDRAVGAGETRIEWLEPRTPAAFTVRLRAAYGRGERDVGYGLALGGPQRHLVAGVSPLGYVSVWETDSMGPIVRMPWQTWPHVRLQRTPNEIQIDVRDGEASVRLNRELLWQGPWTVAANGLGLYAESFSGPTVVRFVDLQVYYE